ncbi:MAG: IS4 family transposase [Nitrosopumilaceae archaeon]|nr:IS4 family transposase [Nitrosopumilaceae archaeon]NIU87943.1 IS4 family transposase [Nitrosopumilaceae archaeon]NIV67129.1 IS4 family transposase [Nitrosopumilaceae archaeon]NIX62116.1 IS4 family transposase [Nitrosopumilaceae archaeon]
MNSGRTILSQIMDFIPKYEFDKCVDKYKGNYRTRKFRCWDQFCCMSFAQLSYRESLRDIEACLNAQPNKLYHMGITGNVTVTNLSRANEKRDWRIVAEFAQILISKARMLYKNDHDFTAELDNTVYALDSTTIDLCLSLFPWAKFRKTKAAIKLHTLLDLRGAIPSFIDITTGLIHDVNILDILIPEPGSYYIMNRGYLDFERLFKLKEDLAFFIVRAKRNLKFRRLYSREIDKTSGLRCDQIIKLTGYKPSKHYPDKLRRVKYHDAETQKYYVFLTNNFDISALTVANLYRYRWKIELFFKWIKQHLKIKAFFGTSPNAVKTQIWIAISIYVLVAIIKKTLKIELSLYTILQILSVSLFEKVPIYQLLTDTRSQNMSDYSSNQLNLFDF